METYGSQYVDRRVQISGLKKRQDLNKRVGEVIGKGTSKERLAVRLEGLRKPLSLKKSNLTYLKDMQFTDASILGCIQRGTPQELRFLLADEMFREDYLELLASILTPKFPRSIIDLLHSFSRSSENARMINLKVFSDTPGTGEFPPLVFAAFYDRRDILEILLQVPCIQVNIVNERSVHPSKNSWSKSETALATAMQVGCNDTSLMLLNHPQMDVDARSPDKENGFVEKLSCLLYAITSSDEVIEKILSHPTLKLETLRDGFVMIDRNRDGPMRKKIDFDNIERMLTERRNKFESSV